MNELERMLINPESGQELCLDNQLLVDDKGNVIAKCVDGVWSFLDVPDQFYEGAYLNRTRYIPSKDNWIGRIPFFFVANGYTWEVCKNFRADSTLLELGCAGGIDFLAKRYNMIGLDLSIASLKSMGGYALKLQATADRIPLRPNSLDGVISSYFWEHIDGASKDRILQSLYRCLRPGGRLVFLYDIETRNGLIRKARDADSEFYKSSFLDRDGHIGYESVEQNDRHFASNGFRVLKHIGMERTWLQSPSVYTKLSDFPGVSGVVGKIGSALSRGRIRNLLNLSIVRFTDTVIGKLWPVECSRIMMTVAERVAQ